MNARWVGICVVLALCSYPGIAASQPASSPSSPPAAPGQISELREIRAVLRDLERSIGQTNGTLKDIDGKLNEVNKTLPRLAETTGGMTAFEVLLLLLTALYMISTFLLWWTTKTQVQVAQGQLGVAKRQSDLADSSLKLARDGYEQTKTATVAATLQQLGANDRAVKALLVQDPDIYAPLQSLVDPFGGRDRPYAERKLRAYLGLVINHAKHVFLQDRLGQLPPNYWEAVDQDLGASVQVPEFRMVWERVAPFQPSEFRDYVQAKIKRFDEEQAKGGTR